MAPDSGGYSLLHICFPKLLDIHCNLINVCNVLLPHNPARHVPAQPARATPQFESPIQTISLFDALFGDLPDPTPCTPAKNIPHKDALNENIGASVSALITDSLQAHITAKNDDIMAWFDHFTQETVAALEASIAAHSMYIAEDKRWKQELSARIDAMDLLMNEGIPPKSHIGTPRSDHRPDEFDPDGKTEMHAPETPNTEFAIQFTKNFIDLRADLDLLPREQHGPHGVLALLDRPPTGDTALPIELPPDFDEESPWENYLNSLPPELCHQVWQDMHSRDVFYDEPLDEPLAPFDEPLDEPLASYDHLLSTWPGAHAAVAAPSTGMYTDLPRREKA